MLDGDPGVEKTDSPMAFRQLLGWDSWTANQAGFLLGAGKTPEGQ